jgi:hypothetical protein
MVEKYPASGTVRAQAYQRNQVSADMFGGGAARGAGQLGNAAMQLSSQMGQIEREEKSKQDAADVMGAYSKATTRLRDILHNPDTGLYNRKGGDARGLQEEIDKQSRQIFDEALNELTDPEQKDAFDSMYGRYHQGQVETASNYVFDQMQTYRAQEKVAIIQAAQSDAVANFNSPAAVQTAIDATRAAVMANPDGLPPEAIAQATREAVSSVHVAVIQRMAQEDPGDALDYYEKVRGEVSGADHARADQIIGGVAQARQAKSAVDEIAGNAGATAVIAQVYGQDDVVPMIDVDPAIAQEVARQLALPEMEDLTPEEAGAWLSSPEGRETNKRVATAYLGQQLTRFDGDLEAALVAVSTSPEDATAWLDGGRNYDVLPQGVFDKVAKVVQRYTGLTVPPTSAGVQAALAGQTIGTFEGDPKAFLGERFNPMRAEDTLDEVPPDTQSRLAAFLSAAPAVVQDYVQVIRGDATGIDLGWMGGSFAEAPPEVAAWVYQNAERFGLGFPDGVAPWRIEPLEARGGGAAGDEDVAGAFAALGLPVSTAQEKATAADFYARPSGPYKVKSSQGTLEDWERLARERYADNPPLLAEVTRQLSNEFSSRADQAKAALAERKRAAFAEIMQGTPVADMDPVMLQELGPEAVGQLLTLEGKFTKGAPDKTDPQTYYKLSQMGPDEFGKLDLMDYADTLSASDFKAMADKQASISRGGGGVEGQRTRTQIMASTQDMLKLDPNKKPEDAERLNQLNRRLDERIAEWSKMKDGAQPNAVEIQSMVDDLIIEGKVKAKGDWWDTTHRAYELTPEELSKFRVAENFDQVPLEAHDIVATGYRFIHQADPNKEQALDYYNDMVSVTLGGSPMPPDDLMAVIGQRLAKELGRVPRDNELAATYRHMLELASGLR